MSFKIFEQFSNLIAKPKQVEPTYVVRDFELAQQTSPLPKLDLMEGCITKKPNLHPKSQKIDLNLQNKEKTQDAVYGKSSKLKRKPLEQINSNSKKLKSPGEVLKVIDLDLQPESSPPPPPSSFPSPSTISSFPVFACNPSNPSSTTTHGSQPSAISALINPTNSASIHENNKPMKMKPHPPVGSSNNSSFSRRAVFPGGRGDSGRKDETGGTQQCTDSSPVTHHSSPTNHHPAPKTQHPPSITQHCSKISATFSNFRGAGDAISIAQQKKEKLRKLNKMIPGKKDSSNKTFQDPFMSARIHGFESTPSHNTGCSSSGSSGRSGSGGSVCSGGGSSHPYSSASLYEKSPVMSNTDITITTSSSANSSNQPSPVASSNQTPWTNQLDSSWSELRFILKKPITSELDLLYTVAAAEAGLMYIDEVTNIAASMNVLKGRLCRWLLPYGPETVIETQCSTAQSVLESMPDDFRDKLTERQVHYLVAGANGVRNLVRVKIADDNDLELARQAVQQAEFFFKRLYAQAARYQMRPFQLLRDQL